jgi:hypothetical protein
VRERESERERQTDRETERQRDRETERQRDRETERQRDREKRDREIETERETETETGYTAVSVVCVVVLFTVTCNKICTLNRASSSIIPFTPVYVQLPKKTITLHYVPTPTTRKKRTRESWWGPSHSWVTVGLTNRTRMTRRVPLM